MTLAELQQKRNKLLNDMGVLSNKAKAENPNGAFTSEQRSQYEAMTKDAVELRETIERETSLASERNFLAQSQGSVVDPLKNHRPSESERDARDVEVKKTPEYRAACDFYLRTNDMSKLRAMDVTTSADGGYTLPTDAASTMVLALNRGAVVRRAGANVITTARNTTIPVSNVISGGWVAEATSFADATPTISAFQANAHKYAAQIPVSDELLADSTVDIQSYLTERFLDDWAQKSDNAYLTGNGSTQPTGLLTTATTKVVLSEETFTPLELTAHFASLPAQYRRDPSCAWIMNDATLGFIAGYSIDLTNRIPFQWATKPGDPDILFGKPVYSSAAMATTFDANAKLAVLGAFKYYQIVDRINNAGIKRLNELLAAQGQVLFLGSWRTDGKCLLADAFRTLTLAAS